MIHSTNNEKYFFEIDKNEDNLFYFNLKDEEGNFYIESDLYVRKTSCQEGIESVINNSNNEERFEVEQIYVQKWMVRMKTVNSKTIAIIPKEFDTEEEAKNFIEDLKSLSFKTPVIDNTKLKN